MSYLWHSFARYGTDTLSEPKIPHRVHRQTETADGRASQPIVIVVMRWSWFRRMSAPVAVATTGRNAAAGDEGAGERDVPRTSDLTLRSVQVIFRHGARTPITGLYGHDVDFPTPPGMEFRCRGPTSPLFFTEARRLYHRHYTTSVRHYEPIVRGPVLAGWCRPGQLTVQGRRDLAAVGTKLRKRYVDELKFLSPEYVPEEVLVRSTDVERTLESAVSLLEALFPANDLTPAVNIRALKEHDENMYPRSSCRALQALKSAAMQSTAADRAKQREALTADVQDWINSKSRGEPIRRFEGIHNTTQCYIANNVPLPHHLPRALQIRIEDEAVYEMNTKYGSFKAARLGIGRFVGDLLHDLRSSASSPSPVRLRLYSGHDSTVGPLAIALQTDSAGQMIGHLKEFPAFASHIIVELYEQKSSGKMWVRAMYSGQRIVEDLDLPGSIVNDDGHALVELEDLATRLAPIIPDPLAYDDECKSPRK